MKNKKDICIVVQARLGSERVPRKMIRPFSGETLVDVLFNKLKSLKSIPQSNIYFSAYEDELKKIANNHDINIFHRSEASAKSEGQPLSEIYDWYNKLPFKYIILVSACNPLLKPETIDSFIESFIESDKEGAFAVFPKKTYYWDENKELITKRFEKSGNMNTKVVETTYEAAHCLYAGKMELIGKGIWMGDFTKNEIELFPVDEKECFDIDYEWQFEHGQKLYK